MKIEKLISLILIVAALFLIFGCASPKYSPVPPASTNDDSRVRFILEQEIDLDPATNAVPTKSGIGLPHSKTSRIELPDEPTGRIAARGTLSFENPDRGPLWYRIERSDVLPARWNLFAEGLSMPGTTTIFFSPTNSMGIFQARWK